MSEFDISSIDESLRPQVEQYIQSQIETAKTGLDTKNKDLLGKLHNSKEELQALNDKAQQVDSAIGELSIEDVKEMIAARDAGDFNKLIGEKKYEEAINQQAAKIVKERQREFNKRAEGYTSQITDLETKFAKADAQNRDMRLGKVGVNAFVALDDHRPSAVSDVERDVLQAFSLDEDGTSVMRDELGEIVLDPKGNPVTPEYFVNEDLRGSKPHYFKDLVGAGAQGSARGRKLADLGLGITQRKGNQDRMSEFYNRAREQGIENPSELWKSMPWDSAS